MVSVLCHPVVCRRYRSSIAFRLASVLERFVRLMNRREGGEQVALIVVVPVNGASYEDN